MSQLAEQKCPACGAAMRFDPPTGKLVCDYCDTVVDIPATAQKTPQKPEEPKEPQEADIQGFDFGHLSDQAAREDAASLPVYNCVSCGAEVIAPAEQMALTCPYCGNNIVLTDKASGRLRPDGVIPFRIESAGLPDAVNRFYRDKKLLPRRFFSESTMGKVTGVYVPFWVFSGTLSGTLTYSGEKSSSTRKGDYVTVRTAHYRLNRGASLAYAELPVDASTKVDNKLMDSLEPFRTEEAKPFDMRYLAGFTADRFDQEKKDTATRAEARMRSSSDSLVRAAAGAGYESVKRSGGTLRANLQAKYLLFPIYLFDILHGNKTYHFAVNGQTGKVVGEVPTDKHTSILYFLSRFGITAGALILISIGKYLLGR